jgi:hypothetical protein
MKRASFIFESQFALVAKVAIESHAALRHRAAQLADPALGVTHGCPHAVALTLWFLGVQFTTPVVTTGPSWAHTTTCLSGGHGKISYSANTGGGIAVNYSTSKRLAELKQGMAILRDEDQKYLDKVWSTSSNSRCGTRKQDDANETDPRRDREIKTIACRSHASPSQTGVEGLSGTRSSRCRVYHCPPTKNAAPGSWCSLFLFLSAGSSSFDDWRGRARACLSSLRCFDARKVLRCDVFNVNRH